MRRFTTILVVGVASGAIFGAAWSSARPEPLRPVPVVQVPACPEDEVLVGTGEFTGGPGPGGRWSSYRCGPALDDFQGR